MCPPVETLWHRVPPAKKASQTKRSLVEVLGVASPHHTIFMATVMRFRDYTSADIEAMFQLDALCFTEPFQFDRDSMRQFAESPGAVVILIDDVRKAEVGRPAQLIAFIILHLEESATGSNAYVVTIDVSPDRRRAGIGTAMLARAEAAARSAGALQITLHVAAGNLAAIGLYERLHYRRSGVARRFYREAGEDAILFVKPL